MLKKVIKIHITIKKRAEVKSVKREYVQIAGLSPESLYQVYGNTLHNILRAVMERLFKVKVNQTYAPPAPPQPLSWSTLLNYERDVLLSNLHLLHAPQEALSLWQTLGRMAAHKVNSYLNALIDLHKNPLSQKDANIKAFVKSEKIEGFVKEDPVPRLIRPRHPRYNLVVARWIKQIEHWIYAAINIMFGGPATVMKNKNAVEVASAIRAKWLLFDNPVAVGLDANRFDQHVSVDALRWEHSIYNRWYKDDELSTLLRWQVFNREYAYTSDNHFLKWRRAGTRCSGDMNTALGNVLLMTSVIHAFRRRSRINFELVNNGDDCVCIMDRKHLKQFTSQISSHCALFGFDIRVEPPAFVFEQLSFCQTQPVWNGIQWIMCRHPLAALAKDTIKLGPSMHQHDLDVWRATVAAGGLALTDGIPLFPSFYRCLSRNCTATPNPLHTNIHDSGFWMMVKGLQYKKRSITDTARVSFFKAFGILPSHQQALEEIYDKTHIDFTPNGPIGSVPPKNIIIHHNLFTKHLFTNGTNTPSETQLEKEDNQVLDQIAVNTTSVYIHTHAQEQATKASGQTRCANVAQYCKRLPIKLARSTIGTRWFDRRRDFNRL